MPFLAAAAPLAAGAVGAGTAATAAGTAAALGTAAGVGASSLAGAAAAAPTLAALGAGGAAAAGGGSLLSTLHGVGSLAGTGAELMKHPGATNSVPGLEKASIPSQSPLAQNNAPSQYSQSSLGGQAPNGNIDQSLLSLLDLFSKGGK